MLLRPQALVIGAALGSALATAVAASMSSSDLAYRRPGFHIALETAASLIGLAAAYLLLGRFRASARFDHLLLVCALAVLAAANLAFGAAPAILSEDPEHIFATWAALLGRTLGSVVFAAAALAPLRVLRRPHHSLVRLLSAAAAVLAAAAVGVALAADRLPVGVSTEVTAGTSGVRLEGHSVVLALQLLSMLAFALAAFGFMRRATALGDDLMVWLAIGAVFAAFARLNYFVFPSLYSDWVYSGDLLRLLFYLAILVGLAREVRRYWAGVAETAVLAERRRLARDLHDGVAQELAFIARKAHRLESAGEEAAHQIAASAHRALADSRRAISALTRPLDEPLEVTLAQAVEDAASRTGSQVDLQLAEDVHVEPEEREGLLRIAAEAVANAAAHARAEHIRVELESAGRVRLRVVDDGTGFDPDASRNGGGFGLTSMRERAEALGADFRLRSSAGRGTEVEVELP